EALRQKSGQMTKKIQPTELRKAQSQKVVSRDMSDRLKAQNKILALGLMLPSLRTYLEPFTRNMFDEERAQQLLDFIKTNPGFDYGETGDGLLPDLRDYGKI